jgi:hypothetical protein
MAIIPTYKNWKPSEPFKGPSGLLNPETQGRKETSESDIEK